MDSDIDSFNGNDDKLYLSRISALIRKVAWLYWSVFGISVIIAFASWGFSALRVEAKSGLQFETGVSHYFGLIDERMPKYELAFLGVNLTLLYLFTGLLNSFRMLAGYAESMLEERMDTEERSNAVIDSAIDAIITVDSSGIIQSFNPAAGVMYGWAVDEVIGRNVNMLVPSPDKERHDGYIRKFLETGGGNAIGMSRQVVALRKDGSRFPMHLSISKAIVKGKVLITGLSHDLSEEKKLTDELIVARVLAEESNERKSLFLANMSHEIRTPLNGMIGFSSVLLKEETDALKLRHLNVIAQNGRVLLELIDDILDLSKLSMSKLELKFDSCDLYEYFADIENSIAHEIKLKGLDYKLEIDNDVPRVLVIDALRLRQVICNILENAVKFTNAGVVLMKVGVERKDDRYDLLIDISDTGVGIRDEDKGKIFVAYEQCDEDGVIENKGAGLGLAIASHIIERMEGEVRFESIVGEGTTFNLRVPGLERGLMDKERIVRAAGIELVRFKGPEILVVDDSIINQQLVVEYLRPYDVKVDVAINGETALELINLRRPDLLLLDVRMPGMGGHSVLQTLRDDSELHDIIVIALSASSIQGNRWSYDGYLMKPLTAANLVFELIKHLPHELES